MCVMMKYLCAGLLDCSCVCLRECVYHKTCLTKFTLLLVRAGKREKWPGKGGRHAQARMKERGMTMRGRRGQSVSAGEGG